ncbi:MULTISPECIES: phage holin family protein [Actinosynnema]|uniref:phage holin family protein n=1 Tax=Actinosynnema TaxID=40566 RepID=UPI0020A2A0A4|nr:phage holin family protein [Actinosynnema pretiosum]MCP2096957.1 putative Holin-X, holin superfamily III [Actinosynnema pretiosum]
MTTPSENTPPPIPSIPLTAENASTIAGETSIGGLVRDATAHVSTLLRAEVELAKAEVTQEVKRGLKGGVFFILALVVLSFSLFFLFIALAEGIAVFLWTWLAYFLVFVLMVVVAVLFALLGKRKMSQLRPPTRTIESAKDTVAVLRRRDDDQDDTP